MILVVAWFVQWLQLAVLEAGQFYFDVYNILGPYLMVSLLLLDSELVFEIFLHSIGDPGDVDLDAVGERVPKYKDGADYYFHNLGVFLYLGLDVAIEHFVFRENVVLIVRQQNLATEGVILLNVGEMRKTEFECTLFEKKRIG